MYCPEDGTRIDIPYAPSGLGTVQEYPPCSGCGTVWRYVQDSPAVGPSYQYITTQPPWEREEEHPSPQMLEDVLKQLGCNHRRLGEDALIASIIDGMEKRAMKVGQCTYYFGSYMVARETIVNAGLTCEATPEEHSYRWVSFVGDDWELISRVEAIQMLSDSKGMSNG